MAKEWANGLGWSDGLSGLKEPLGSKNVAEGVVDQEKGKDRKTEARKMPSFPGVEGHDGWGEVVVRLGGWGC
jgi:hypothetical protein